MGKEKEGRSNPKLTNRDNKKVCVTYNRFIILLNMGNQY